MKNDYKTISHAISPGRILTFLAKGAAAVLIRILLLTIGCIIFCVLLVCPVIEFAMKRFPSKKLGITPPRRKPAANSNRRDFRVIEGSLKKTITEI